MRPSSENGGTRGGGGDAAAAAAAASGGEPYRRMVSRTAAAAAAAADGCAERKASRSSGDVWAVLRSRSRSAGGVENLRGGGGPLGFRAPEFRGGPQECIQTRSICALLHMLVPVCKCVVRELDPR